MLAFERLEPFGARADQFIGGQVAATIANCHRDAKTTPEPYSAGDFMPLLRPEGPLLPAQPETIVIGAELSPDQLSALLDATIFGKTRH